MIRRILNVLYAILLFGGVILIFDGWMILTNKGDSFNYKVICDNQKVFDPTSKPIRKQQINRYGSFSFDDDGIRAECKNGIAWNEWGVGDVTFDLITIRKEKQLSVGLKLLLPVFFIYNITLEIIRRTFLYIVYGKPYFVTKDKRDSQ